MSRQIVIIHHPKKKKNTNVNYADHEIRDIFKKEYNKQQSLFGFFDFSRFLGRKRMSKFLHVQTRANADSQADVRGIDKT